MHAVIRQFRSEELPEASIQETTRSRRKMVSTTIRFWAFSRPRALRTEFKPQPRGVARARRALFYVCVSGRSKTMMRLVVPPGPPSQRRSAEVVLGIYPREQTKATGLGRLTARWRSASRFPQRNRVPRILCI